MSRQRNQNDGNLSAWMKKVERFMNNSNMNHSAIGREGLEVYDGGWIRILNGGLQVIGTATISGVLDVTGTFNASGDNNMSGTNNLSGENHLTGPTDVAGNFEIIAGGLFKSGTVEIRPDGSADFGTLNIESDGTLNVNNDVNVMENGIINVGTNMKLTPSDDGGAMVFQDGSKVSSVGGTVQVKSSSPGVGLTAGLNTASIGAGPTGALISVDDLGDWAIEGLQASIQGAGSSISLSGDLTTDGALTVNGADTTVNTAAYFNGAVRFNTAFLFLPTLPTSTQPANLYVSPTTNRLYRSTA